MEAEILVMFLKATEPSTQSPRPPGPVDLPLLASGCNSWKKREKCDGTKSETNKQKKPSKVTADKSDALRLRKNGSGKAMESSATLRGTGCNSRSGNQMDRRKKDEFCKTLWKVRGVEMELAQDYHVVYFPALPTSVDMVSMCCPG